MMSLSNASITSKSISVTTYSSTTTRLKLKTEFSFHKTHIFYSLFPKGSIMVACVICPHNNNYRITILRHRLLCPSIKSFFSAPTAYACNSRYGCVAVAHKWSFPHMEHFIRPIIHADKVVQCTASGHNQPLSRKGEGVHFIQDREPCLQHAKASFNHHSQWQMPIIEQLLWGSRLPVRTPKLLGMVACRLMWGEECNAYCVPRVNEVVQSCDKSNNHWQLMLPNTTIFKWQ